MTRATRRHLSLVIAVGLAGCASSSSAGPQAGSEVLAAPLAADTAAAVTETDVIVELPAGFDYDGRRYHLSCGVIDPGLVEPAAFATGEGDMGAQELLHRIRGVDPAILVAVHNVGLCDLAPDQAWQSAFSVDELRAAQPSAAYNEAWCTASLYGPDPAEGFSC